jgi:hypothetical protein
MSINKEIKKKETTFIRPTRKMLRVKENQCREKQETSNRKKKVIEMLPPNPPNTNNSAQSKISMKITAPHGANQGGKKSSNSTEQTTDDRMLVTAFTLHEYGFSCSCFCGNL